MNGWKPRSSRHRGPTTEVSPAKHYRAAHKKQVDEREPKAVHEAPNESRIRTAKLPEAEKPAEDVTHRQAREEWLRVTPERRLTGKSGSESHPKEG